MKSVWPLRKLVLCLDLLRVYRNPNGLTSKLTKSVRCPKRVGSQVPRGPALLRRSLLGVFLPMNKPLKRLSY